MNLKEIESLQKSKYRKETGLFFLEGLRACREAIIGNAEIVRLVCTETFSASKDFDNLINTNDFASKFDAKSFLIKCSDKAFARLSETVTPQGIGAVIRIPDNTIEDAIANSNDRGSRFGILVLENIQDPGNLGTIIRTADAGGMKAVICTKDTVDIYNAKTLRSTVGSVFRLPIVKTNLTGKEIADILKSENYETVCAHPRNGTGLYDAEFCKNTAIFIGNEANGLNRETLSACDKLITIPMPGGTESLNASVAAALMIYELNRKGELK